MGSSNSLSSTTKKSLRARTWLRISSFSRTTPWSSRESGRREKEEEAMKCQLGLSLVVLAVLSAPHAWSQTSTDQSQNGSTDQSQSGSTGQSQSGSTGQSQSNSADQSQNGSTDQSQQSSTGPQVAYTNSEQLPPLSLLNEVTANTGIQLFMTTGALMDYNASAGSSPGYWQTLGTIGGGVHITQIRPTLLWNFQYYGGVGLNAVSSRGLSNYNTLNQNAAANILWQFSKHWQLAVTDGSDSY